MSLADVESASIDGDMFRATLVAASDAPLVCQIDDDSFASDIPAPHGARWDISLNLNEFYFDPDYWDGARYMGWRIIFDPDVIMRFLDRDLSWMEDWF